MHVHVIQAGALFQQQGLSAIAMDSNNLGERSVELGTIQSFANGTITLVNKHS